MYPLQSNMMLVVKARMEGEKSRVSDSVPVGYTIFETTSRYNFDDYNNISKCINNYIVQICPYLHVHS